MVTVASNGNGPPEAALTNTRAFSMFAPVKALTLAETPTAPAITVTVTPAVRTDGTSPPEMMRFNEPDEIFMYTASFPVEPSLTAYPVYVRLVRVKLATLPLTSTAWPVPSLVKLVFEISAAFAGDEASIADEAVLLLIVHPENIAPPVVICPVRLNVELLIVAVFRKIKVSISIKVHDSMFISAASIISRAPFDAVVDGERQTKLIPVQSTLELA